MYKLTHEGIKKTKHYIDLLKEKRKEILDGHKDTAGETNLPTVEDIEADLNFDGVDEDGCYYNNWGVTDNYDGDTPIGLELGVDFIEE